MILNTMTYLETAAARCPDRICWADAEQSLSYREVLARVQKMGNALQAHLGPGNRPVGVIIRHTVSDLLAFFSIVFSGNFYVPIDPALPEERIRKMLAVVRPAALIETQASELQTLFDIPCCSEDTLLAESVCPQSVPGWKTRKDADPLYVIFTSGSTGEPKGVTISHRAVIDMAEQFCLTFGFSDGTVFGNQAPFDFDVSVKDIYIGLKVAGTVEILEKKLFSFPKLLIDRLNERHVDTVIWAVPALKIIAGLRAFQHIRPLYLKYVMFSGEVMPPKTLAYWMDNLPDACYVNLYGPTEITCNCTYFIVHDAAEVENEVPIGGPFANCDVFLLDADSPVEEEGKIGEICVSGTCVSLGYYNRPDLSERAFVQNPLQSMYSERIYRTGDLGMYKNGNLIFCGRKDTQIKYMGHRIEMTEIELCANTAQGVDASACVFEEEATRLTMFYTGAAEEKALFGYLREKLPRYMLPGSLKKIDVFPVTRTGKIDRKQLLKLLKEGGKNG